MDFVFPADPQEHIKDALSLVEGRSHRLQNPAVLRNQLRLFRIQIIHVIQNCGAGNGDGAGVGHIGDGHVLRLHWNGLALRNRVGLKCVLAGPGSCSIIRSVRLRRAAAQQQQRQQQSK